MEGQGGEFHGNPIPPALVVGELKKAKGLVLRDARTPPDVVLAGIGNFQKSVFPIDLPLGCQGSGEQIRPRAVGVGGTGKLLNDVVHDGRGGLSRPWKRCR